jgi:medium-chain acyl-[acyl-carrier-protein] hydrolase
MDSKWTCRYQKIPMRNPWLPIRQPCSRARMRLFCFPYAGGSASAYGSWTRLLEPEIELCALELPGRWTRLQEAPLASVSEIVQGAAEAVERLLDVPFAVFGYSFGALLAYDFSRRLTSHHRVPLGLFAAASPAPDARQISRLAHVPRQDDFIERLARIYGPLPAVVLEDPEAKKLAVRILRADMQALESYPVEPRSTLQCPIAVAHGRDDDTVSIAAAKRWRNYTSSTFSFCAYPGSHFFLHSAGGEICHDLHRRMLQWCDQ